MTVTVRRSPVEILAHPSRVICRPFDPGHEGLIQGLSRSQAVMARVLAMTEEQVSATLEDTLATYANRHDDLRAHFRRNYEIVTADSPPPLPLPTQDFVDLIGAYFTQEYSIEGAALFNPSIVPAPDQTGCQDGELRFILSLRAVGEGHLSSIEFRAGCIGSDGSVTLEAPSPHLSTGAVQQVDGDRYAVAFDATTIISERVLFPATSASSHGLEDARFVRFTHDDGSRTYYATYTAYDGSRVAPFLLQTDDFMTFRMEPMLGPAAANKGMALFPRPIGGSRWSLSRWDRENISVSRRDAEAGWTQAVVVQVPRQPWELIQLGACTSPIETAKGWLVLTHGVGPMRTYAIGALLLDLEDPTRVIGVREAPLLMPAETERDGYVPNVVYSCGALVHGDILVLPYGCSDASVRFANIDLPALLAGLTSTTHRKETESA